MLEQIKWKVNGFINEYWNIGFIQNELSEIVEKRNVKLDVKWLKHHYSSAERWFADPFIIDVDNDCIYLLVEEWYAPISRGRISKLIIDRGSYELLEIIPVLELDTHLSFPFISRCGERIFINPENSKSGKHALYEYFPQKEKCVLITTLVCDELTDTALLAWEGEEYLFTTIGEMASKNVLNIFVKQSDRYVHMTNYVFNENVARMAGDFFNYKGVLYRPSQECNNLYGHAVCIQKVSKTGENWGFEEVNRLYSPSSILDEGLHTFNIYNGVIVTDAVGHHGNKFTRKVLEKVRSSFVAL